jgi:hypothetical protein
MRLNLRSTADFDLRLNTKGIPRWKIAFGKIQRRSPMENCFRKNTKAFPDGKSLSEDRGASFFGGEKHDGEREDCFPEKDRFLQ